MRLPLSCERQRGPGEQNEKSCIHFLILDPALLPFPGDDGIVWLASGDRENEEMAVRIVRLGSERVRGEGLRIGTVRRPPRGVPKTDYASRDFYDVWLPDLAPSAGIIAGYKDAQETDAAWRRLERLYRAEMKRPERERLLTLLAALSHTTDFSVGCYCADERRCHRSILKVILLEHGAEMG